MKIYLINLTKDTERLALMTEQLHGLGMPFERMEAIHGVNMPGWLRPYFLAADGSIASDLSKGEVGCYASHLAVMLRVIEVGEPALVLEDDIEIEPNLSRILGRLPLPEGWDIVRLSNHFRRGYVPVREIPDSRFSVVKFCRVPPSTGAYMISPAEAMKFLAWKGLRILPVDQDLRRVWDCRMETYGIHPRPVRPNIGESSIAAMDSRAIIARKHRKRLSEKLRDVLDSVMWLGPVAWLRAQLRLVPRDSKSAI